MKIKFLFLTLGVIALNQQLAQANGLLLNPKIDKYVQDQFKLTHQLKNSVFVILKDQADLSAADAFASREEKGRYVYETLRNKAIATQKPLIGYLQSKKINFQQFYIENMIAVQNPTVELINALVVRTDVIRIMGNPHFKLKLPKTNNILTNTFASGPEKNLVRIGATKVWDQYKVRGEGIVVAGQDTGVQWDHPALIHQYRGSHSDGTVDHNYNWHDAIHQPNGGHLTTNVCGYDTSAPCDDFGHGTHTIGTVVGDDGKGHQIGVAPKAQWIACRNMDNGNGTPQSYIECFEFLLAPYPLHGNSLTDGDPSKAPHVINNSWGCTTEEGCQGDEILPSLIAMKKAGIMVVASAGNEGPACGSIGDPPAWHSGLTLSVGAFDHRNNRIAYFSSRGPSALDHGIGPLITAPGVNIRSSVPGNGYESYWSGTSMAGPHAVGAVALLWSLHKNLIGQIDQTVSVIENGAEPVATLAESCGGVPGTHIPNNTYGYGLLNVYQAASIG